jgi:hypothetical protein
MWRIYSPKSDGVRIRSTPERLVNSLNQVGQPAFVGKVLYLSTKHLIAHARTALASGTNEGSARTLLVKRPAFRHEREVRVLACSPKLGKDLVRYPIDPHSLIDQIMIDPRLDRNAADALKARIRHRTGFSGQILRSLLYAPPRPLM